MTDFPAMFRAMRIAITCARYAFFNEALIGVIKAIVCFFCLCLAA